MPDAHRHTHRNHNSRRRQDAPPQRRRQHDDEPKNSTLNALVGHLHALDGRSYAAYKSILGHYTTPEGWSLHLDRIQPDPYAPPTHLRVHIPTGLNGFRHLDAELLASPQRRLALSDLITRHWHDGCRGTALSIAHPGAALLERSSVVLIPGPADLGPEHTEQTHTNTDTATVQAPQWTIEVRCRVSLPAQGRSIQGRSAARILSKDLPRIIDSLQELCHDSWPTVRRHLDCYEDYCALQAQVREHGWVAFLADGSLLPRRSGVSEEPLSHATPLHAPESLAATVTLPHAGQVRGTVIPAGVTVIVGGGYHGKSTLMNAIEQGVYAHIPGDGRELVATDPSATKVRAADGRAVTGVTLTPFISHLPGGQPTDHFSTPNASGSTSQAASLMEAVEVGAHAILMDEDTSATNLLIRDSRMRDLVTDEHEPITPLVDRVQALHRERGVSTILVMGGSGDYLDVADHVLLMDSYRLSDATAQAHELVQRQPRSLTALADCPPPQPRIPLPSPPRTRRGPVRTRAVGLDEITLDRQHIDVTDVSGIVDPAQTEAMAWAVRAVLEQRADGESTLSQCMADLDALLDDEGLDALADPGSYPAFFARPRTIDVAAALNRYRLLELATHQHGMTDQQDHSA